MIVFKNFFFRQYLPATIVMLMIAFPARAQVEEKERLVNADSLTTTTITGDTSQNGKSKKVRVYNPRKAALRSAILPGLGQIYNKKYWKVPIVYGVLGTTAGIFAYNLTNYRDTRFAYQAIYKASQSGATAADSVDYWKVKPRLRGYSLETLRYYRDQFRRDIDYSVLFFILFWGLNIVDAAVDAHLKAFDVSPDLSLKIKPGRSKMAGTNGISLILAFR